MPAFLPRFLSSLLLLVVFPFVVKAQTTAPRGRFSQNFAAYVGYAILNEPNITLEYRVGKRLAVNLEGAVFVPYVRKKYRSPVFDRVNYLGGSLRTGVAIYSKWPRKSWLMHRVMFDITYASSNLFIDDPWMYAGTTQVVVREMYRNFMQYAVFYECTFRLFAGQKRHHLFVRAGFGARALHTYVTDSYTGSGEDVPIQEPYRFRVNPAPVFSLGYRFRLVPQRNYFARDEE